MDLSSSNEPATCSSQAACDEPGVLKTKRRIHPDTQAHWNKPDPLEKWWEWGEKIWFLVEGMGSLATAWYMTVQEHKGTTLLQAVQDMDSRIEWEKVAIGCLCICINTCLMVFYTIYLPWIKQIPVDSEQWKKVAPWTFPTTVILGAVAMVSFTRALWPLQGVYSMVTTITYTLSTLTILQLLPGWSTRAKEKQG